MKLYIAVLDEFPDYMTPTLVAHAVLGAHLKFAEYPEYQDWLANSFRKVVLRVDPKEFYKISELENIYLGFEKHTMHGQYSCIVVCPRVEIPNVLRFAKLWDVKKLT
jgi:hypothetical protein